jgi:hypothetical protein
VADDIGATERDGGNDESALDASQQSAQDAAVVDALMVDATDTKADAASRRTVLDAANAAEGEAASNATVLDAVVAASGGAAPARNRLNLPHELAERFVILETITRGAEADVVVVREEATGELRAIKLYRDAASRVDSALLAALSEAAPEHVVQTYYRGHDGDEWWEELEYCPEGSLADLFARENTGAGLPTARIREILDELIPAITHLHTLSSGGRPLVHRDLKPANILVRSTQPRLDLVIADFGLARLLDATRELRSRSRTIEYAAPESSWGEISPARDWWSLGIMVVEFATGRHPFVDDYGQAMEPAAIEAHIQRHRVDTAPIGDLSLRTLARGLLVRDPTQRWGASETKAWQRGETPPIHDTRFFRQRNGAVFVCGDHEYRSPDELAEAWARNWDEGAAVMAGSSDFRRERRALRDFLAASDFTGEDIQRLNSIFAEEDASEHRRLVELLAVLDPELPAIYRGRPVDPTNLHGLAAEGAHGDASSLEVIDTLANDEVLRLFAGKDGCERYAAIEQQWHRQTAGLREHLEQMTSGLPGRDEAMLDRLEQTARAVLLILLMDGADSTETTEMLDAARGSIDAMEVSPYRRAARAENLGLPQIAALVSTEPLATRVGSGIRERRETEKREQLARERSELTATARRAVWRAIVGVLVATAGLGILALRFSFSGWTSFPGAFHGSVPEPVVAVLLALAPTAAGCMVLLALSTLAHDLIAARSERISYLGRGRRLAWMWLLGCLIGGGVAARIAPWDGGTRSLHAWPLALAAYAATVIIAIGVHAAGGWRALREPGSRRRAAIVATAGVVMAAVTLLATTVVDHSTIDGEASAWRADSKRLVSAGPSKCRPAPFEENNPYLTGMRAQMTCIVLATPVVVSWFKNHESLAAYNNSLPRQFANDGLCREGSQQFTILRGSGGSVRGRFYCRYAGRNAHTEWTYSPVLALAQTMKVNSSLIHTYRVYRHFKFDEATLSGR